MGLQKKYFWNVVGFAKFNNYLFNVFINNPYCDEHYSV